MILRGNKMLIAYKKQERVTSANLLEEEQKFFLMAKKLKIHFRNSAFTKGYQTICVVTETTAIFSQFRSNASAVVTSYLTYLTSSDATNQNALFINAFSKHWNITF